MVSDKKWGYDTKIQIDVNIKECKLHLVDIKLYELCNNKS